MAYAEHFLVSHPATLLAVTIILSQAGLPVSSAPLLLLIGALARSEGLDAPIALLMVVPGCVFVDCVWFELGHIRKSARSRWGRAKARKTFRIPDVFARHGGAAMLVARFLPGPNLVAAIAGYSNVSRVRFILQDTVASALWASLYLSVGYFLPQRLRSHLCSFVNTSPGCAILLTLGLTAAVLGALRLGLHMAKRRARRLVDPSPNASEPIISGPCLNPEGD